MPKIRHDASKTVKLESERKYAIITAKELCYSNNVILRLETAKNTEEIFNIMHDARKGLIA
jgi:hypothetical protein